MTPILVLSGGAAQGLARALERRVVKETGRGLAGQFGAVGAMRELVEGGAPVDVVILTRAIVEDLARADLVAPDTIADVGTVETAIAAKAGAEKPEVGDADALKRALLLADAIYLPDPTKATAGIHFAGVLDRLGVAGVLRGRLRPHPNGAAAMRAMAEGPEANPIGCTQATEIIATSGVKLVAPLPAGFDLATTYTAAVAARAQAPDAARRLVAILADPAESATRRACGFA